MAEFLITFKTDTGKKYRRVYTGDTQEAALEFARGAANIINHTVLGATKYNQPYTMKRD